MALLDQIQSPAQIKSLSISELQGLAGEIRARIVDAVSLNGGHLASNLGVVELTLALHYVYDFGPFPAGPDRLLFDVGHQCYPHKMLTGRAGRFSTLRKRGSVSGFPNPDESPYDLFHVGHAGTAISTAMGMARGDWLRKHTGNVVAIVGDASIVNGLAFEGLNQAGTLRRQLLIVLNDNGMSISKPQGAFAQYLERLRISTTYDEAKKIAERIVGRLPVNVAHTVESVWHHVKEGLKSAVWPGQVFESFGIKYMGPADGHDLPGLIQLLAEIKHVQAPLLLHARTIKGLGCQAACAEPTRFHSPSSFKLEGDHVQFKIAAGKSWTSAFSDALIELARKDERVVALTAAMPDGTGLAAFEPLFPDRYRDTGICESHLAAMAGGMAKSGLRPFAAVYSTFTQRAFDQIWQEVALQHLPVVFCMDRAGLVGDDGAVHHGFMDQAFLRPMPGMVLMAPSDEPELNRALRLALQMESPCAVRYPRDLVPAEPYERIIEPDLRPAAAAEWLAGKSRLLRQGDAGTLLVYGALMAQAMAAAEQLAQFGQQWEVVDARFCKPIDGAMLQRVLRSNHPVLTIEDHSLQNGFGSAVLEYAAAHRLPTQWITRLGLPDRLIPHATRAQQLADVGLDAPGITARAKDALAEAEQSNVSPSRAAYRPL